MYDVVGGTSFPHFFLALDSFFEPLYSSNLKHQSSVADRAATVDLE